MKRILITLIVIIGICTISIAQNRNNFKYQAVVRNNQGEVIANQLVSIKVSIFQGSESGTPAYIEEHKPTTNAFGLVALNIGNGTVTSGVFNDIDWGNDSYFLKLELDIEAGTNYQVMGTSPLLSVPYSLHAETVSNANIEGEADMNLSEALFAVVNSSGDTVFAVYQEGVRVNVGNGAQKALGSRGGFAVGNLSSGKANEEYLRVTRDSVRIYIDESAKAIGSRGGFAVGNLSSGKGNSNYMQLNENNYFIGHRSGVSNTTGLYNTFFGYESGTSNTEGSDNIFIGHGSGYFNTIGESNVFVGNEAGYENTEGLYNVFLGNYAGTSNTLGEANVIIGDAAGEDNTLGNSNVFVGDWSGKSNTEGEGNVFLGSNSGWNNLTGNYNVFLGESTGYTNSIGEGNVFLGSSTGFSNTIGSWNVFLGEECGFFNTLGEGNTFVGPSAGYTNTEGEENVYMGAEAGYTNSRGSNNVFLGSNAGYFETGSNKLYISNYDADSTESLIFGNFMDEILQVNYMLGIGKYPEINELELEGDASKTTAGEWFANSDVRIKTDIQDIDNALETIMSLRPVKFKYSEYWKTKHPSIEDKYYYNFVAQEYQTVFPNSVKKGSDFIEGKSGEKVLQLDSYNAQIVSVKAIQELALENQELKKMILELTKRIENLEQSKSE